MSINSVIQGPIFKFMNYLFPLFWKYFYSYQGQEILKLQNLMIMLMRHLSMEGRHWLPEQITFNWKKSLRKMLQNFILHGQLSNHMKWTVQESPPHAFSLKWNTIDRILSTLSLGKGLISRTIASIFIWYH